MTQEEIKALLGRPLTPNEDANFALYLEIAQESLEELLCISLQTNPEGSGDRELDTRSYDVRDGYSTVFTDIFTELTEVRVDGIATADYYEAFWDKRSSDYYNSIVLDDKCVKSVEITGYWGFTEVPKDLQMLWAQLFANVSKKYQSGAGNVKSKQTEDFRITYGDLTDDQVFINDNARTIKKYRMCDISYVRHGDVCEVHGRRDCGYCL